MSTVEAFKRIRKEVRSGKFKPIYLLHGEGAFYIDRVAAEIEAHALQEHERDFNLTRMYAKDTTPDQVKDACLRYPMMAERQVVVLREAQGWRIDTFDELLPYFKKPTSTTVLVICYKHKKVDGRRAWLKDLKNTGTIFTSDKLKDEELPEWIQMYVAAHKRTIGHHETILLSEHLGSDLDRVSKEVEKLCLNSKEGEPITADMIQDHVGISKDHNNFALQVAIGKRDRNTALRIAHFYAKDPGNHPLMMTIGILNGYITKLVLAHTLADKQPKDLASLMKVPPFFVNDYRKAAANFTLPELINAQHLLRECEMQAKGTNNVSASDGELLSQFLIQVIDK